MFQIANAHVECKFLSCCARGFTLNERYLGIRTLEFPTRWLAALRSKQQICRGSKTEAGYADERVAITLLSDITSGAWQSLSNFGANL